MYIKGQTLPNSNCCYAARRCHHQADEHSPNDILNNYDFSNESHSRTFTVTSEDGEWTATYTVKVVPAEMPETFHFEDLLPSAGTEYDIFYESNPELQPVFHA